VVRYQQASNIDGSKSEFYAKMNKRFGASFDGATGRTENNPIDLLNDGEGGLTIDKSQRHKKKKKRKKNKHKRVKRDSAANLNTPPVHSIDLVTNEERFVLNLAGGVRMVEAQRCTEKRRKGRPSLIRDSYRAELAKTLAMGEADCKRRELEKKKRFQIRKRTTNVPRAFRQMSAGDYETQVRKQFERDKARAIELSILDFRRQIELHNQKVEMEDLKRRKRLEEELDKLSQRETSPPKPLDIIEIDDDEVNTSGFQSGIRDGSDAEMLSRSSLEKDEEENSTFVGPEGETLGDEELREIEQVWADEGNHAVPMKTCFNAPIYQHQLHCLRDGEWLNDEVINFFLSILLSKTQLEFKNATPEKTIPKVWIWNTHFYVKLSGEIPNKNTHEYSYGNVRKWTKRKKIDVLTLDRMIVPIHAGVHWSLAVVNFKDKRFEYFDSLNLDNEQCLGFLRKWLIDEVKDKKQLDWSLDDWEDVYHHDIPQQTNSYDCGVFLCSFAATAGVGNPINFSMKNIPYLRRKMLLDILRFKSES